MMQNNTSLLLMLATSMIILFSLTLVSSMFFLFKPYYLESLSRQLVLCNIINFTLCAAEDKK
jgi:hypothetical protein